jgi:hypothetical protein
MMSIVNDNNFEIKANYWTDDEDDTRGRFSNGILPDVNANMSYRDTIHLEKVLENAAKKREKRLDILKQRVKKILKKNNMISIIR